MEVRSNRRLRDAFAILALLFMGVLTAGAAVASVTGSETTSSLASTAKNEAADFSPQCTVTLSGRIQTSDPLQVGRLITLVDASTCASPRGCPGVFDNISRHFDSYTFTNPNSTQTCVTVRLTPGLTGVQLQSAAYLGSFDPLNTCANYLADIGPIPNATGGEYTFSVAPGATYVVVVNELVPSVGSMPYELSVTSDPNCPGGTQTPTTPTPTPTPTVNVGGTMTSVVATLTALAGTSTPNAGTQTAIAGTQTAVAATQTAQASTPTAVPTAAACTVNGVIEQTDGSQLGRLITVATASTCNTPHACPGVFDSLTRHYDSYSYINSSNAAACIVVRVNPGSAGILLQSAAYLNSFNPLDLCQNYLADIGPVPNTLGGEYSFTVPAGATFVVTVNELVPNAGTQGYTLTVSSAGGISCPTNSTPTPTPTVNVGGTVTSVVATLTALAGTSTPNAGTQTAIAGATQTALAMTPTSTPCSLQFTDVPTNHTFYTFIRCLVCRGVISGYADGTFRPENHITRGQIAKMVSNAAGLNEPVSGQFYTDVPPSNTFYVWIQRLSVRGVMSGYPCGGVGEPCDTQNRPYFRWNLNATRGQLSKIVSNSAGFSESASGQFYTDVPQSNPFYQEIMRLTNRNVMSGYPCGGVGEPCDMQDRPYFRWAVNVTRGQASKIVANTFFPNCVTP